VSRTHKLAAATTAAAVGLGTTAAVTLAAAGHPDITSLTEKQHGRTVTAIVTTKDFQRRAGYVRFVLDGGKYDYAQFTSGNGKRADSLSLPGVYTASTTKKVTYAGLPKGRHTIVATLVRNDQVAYKAATASKRLTFTVR
jgi:hypothetical protein